MSPQRDLQISFQIAQTSLVGLVSSSCFNTIQRSVAKPGTPHAGTWAASTTDMHSCRHLGSGEGAASVQLLLDSWLSGGVLRLIYTSVVIRRERGYTYLHCSRLHCLTSISPDI